MTEVPYDRMSERHLEAPPGTSSWPPRLDEPAPAAEPTTGMVSGPDPGPPTMGLPGMAPPPPPPPTPPAGTPPARTPPARTPPAGIPPAGIPPAASAPANTAPAGGRDGVPHLRLLPRTVLGITSMLLALAVGAGLSGVGLYSYYQYRLDQTDRRVNALIHGYRTQFLRAEADLRAAAAAGKAQIQAAAAGGLQAGTDPAAQRALVRALSPSLFVVTTQDTSGAPSVATAFVVSSSATESLLLTSYSAVAAATTSPGPAVYVRPASGSGPGEKVTVRTWDPTHDLAIIVLPVGHLPVLQPAPRRPGPQLGQTVFAVSALGGEGGAIASGEVDDVSSVGIANDIPIGPSFQGAPVVNARGAVLGVASRTYAPLGFAPSGVWYAPFVRMACDRVLSCPGGAISSSS